MRPLTLLRRRTAAFDSWMASHPLAYATLVVVATCVVMGLFIDLPFLLYLQTGSWQAIKPAFKTIEILGRAEGFVTVAVILYFVCLVAAQRLKVGPVTAWYRWLGRHCLLYFASLIASAAVIHLLKNLIARTRPKLFLEEGLYGLGMPFDGYPWDSFPSGHTQTAFVTATVLALLVPRWAKVFFLLAAMVGFARIVTGWHYLSDIVASAFVAVVIVRLLARIVLDPERTWLDQAPYEWLRRH